MFFKWAVGAFMLGKRGSTLIESLFAFEIFISVLVIYMGLMTNLFSNETKISQYYQDVLKKEGEISFSEDFTELIQMALH